ncbi:MAG: aminodeoxychorismate synthase component I [Porphyromonadaceae bacterium]|nr:aminodeoxychorismate synthase component I [Porphyromonadaceae bacterium]
MNTEQFKQQLAQYAIEGKKFLFIVDFEQQNPFVCLLSEAAEKGIFYDIMGETNGEPYAAEPTPIELKAYPIKKQTFLEKFDYVVTQQKAGNSYLLNLTVCTPIELNLSLKDIFYRSKAKYKLLFKDDFVVFSPECFVKIVDGNIYTYPMKGTINADIENAHNKLMNNHKEESEHNTIVDLMRNDISMIATETVVSKYRYIDTIQTHKSRILQTSSEITAHLPHDWRQHLGDIIWQLLPAGSISGAPKQKTVEIIRTAEGKPRGYYTGIFGIFDGNCLESAVMIRFIEQCKGKLFFRSGGGITAQSSGDDEYQELIEKIYVPIV